MSLPVSVCLSVNDYHKTLQNYQVQLWEENIKLWGLILLKMADWQPFGVTVLS